MLTLDDLLEKAFSEGYEYAYEERMYTSKATKALKAKLGLNGTIARFKNKADTVEKLAGDAISQRGVQKIMGNKKPLAKIGQEYATKARKMARVGTTTRDTTDIIKAARTPGAKGHNEARKILY